MSYSGDHLLCTVAMLVTLPALNALIQKKPIVLNVLKTGIKNLKRLHARSALQAVKNVLDQVRLNVANAG